MEANIEELKTQLANLIARVSMAEAQIAEMDDDYFEPRNGFFGDELSEGDFAFKITATVELVGDPPAPAVPPTYRVSVLGGPTQVLGGEEHIYPDMIGEDAATEVADDSFVWLRYKLWDASANAVCEWDDEIHVTADPPPIETSSPKSLVFLLGKVGADYINNVRQDRVGAIQAVATLNASPDFDEVRTAPLV